MSGPKTFIESLKRLMGENNPNYRFYYDFILKNAEEKQKESFTEQEEQELLDIIGSDKYPEKECYTNSRKLLLHQKGEQLDYFEGWVDAGMIPVEHAWCEYNGKIVDVTLVDREPEDLKNIPVKHREQVSEHTKHSYPDAVYYGVKIPQRFVMHEMVEQRPYVLNDFVLTCIKPLKEGRKTPDFCGDLKEYKV